MSDIFALLLEKWILIKDFSEDWVNTSKTTLNYHLLRKKMKWLSRKTRVYHFDEWVNETYFSIAYTFDESVVKSLVEKSLIKELCNKCVVHIKCVIFIQSRALLIEKYVFGAIVLMEF